MFKPISIVAVHGITCSFFKEDSVDIIKTQMDFSKGSHLYLLHTSLLRSRPAMNNETAKIVVLSAEQLVNYSTDGATI